MSCNNQPVKAPELDGGRLVVRPEVPAMLAELLSGIKSENLHEEWADGPPAGAPEQVINGNRSPVGAAP